VGRQPLGQRGRRPLGALQPDDQCPDAAQRQPGLERSRDRAGQRPVGAQAVEQAGVPRDEHAEQHVRVPGQVLGRRVHDDVGAGVQGVLQQGRRERVAHRHPDARLPRGRAHRRQVRHLDERVRRRLDVQPVGVRKRRPDAVGVGGVHPGHAQIAARLVLLGEGEHRVVRRRADHEVAAAGHELEQRGPGRHAGRERDRALRCALEPADRLLERRPGRVAVAAVDRQVRVDVAGLDVRARQFDARPDRGSRGPARASGDDRERFA